jgi:hypothetical protein
VIPPPDDRVLRGAPPDQVLRQSPDCAWRQTIFE